jgi:hypothetical protein
MLERFNQSWFSTAILALGVAVWLVGFGYDALYAGLPYPGNDVPLQLQQAYERNRAFANRIEWWGGTTGAVGLGLLGLQLLAHCLLSLTRRMRPAASPPR